MCLGKNLTFGSEVKYYKPPCLKENKLPTHKVCILHNEKVCKTFPLYEMLKSNKCPKSIVK